MPPPSYSPQVDEEEDVLPAPLQPVVRRAPPPVLPPAPQPRVGSTGGILPEQGYLAGEDVSKPRNQSVQWSGDPLERQGQVQAEVARRKEEQFQQKHPFSTSFERRPAPTHQELHQGAQQADLEFQSQRYKEIAARKQLKAQATGERKARSNEREAQFRATGQQFYTDTNQELQPVLDVRGQPLYHATKPELTEHPKTGTPVMGWRDVKGQRQFKELPVVSSDDPLDENLYHRLPDGTLHETPAGKAADLIGSPINTVAKAARAAVMRRNNTLRKQAVQPLKTELDAAELELHSAKVQSLALDTEMKKLEAGAATDPAIGAQVQQLQLQKDAIDESLKGGTQLTLGVAGARLRHDAADLTSKRDAFIDNEQAILAGHKARGVKDPNSDPTFLSNRRDLMAVAHAADVAEKQLARYDEVMRMKATVAAPPVKDTSSSWLGDMAKRAGRSMVKMPGQMVEGAAMLADAVGRGAAVMGAAEDAAANSVSPQAALQNIRGAANTPFPGTQTAGATGRQMTQDAASLYEVPGMVPDVRRNQEIFAQAADSVGSLAGAMVTPGGLVAKTAAGAILNSQSQAEEARQIMSKRGAPESAQDAEALNQFVLNLPAGALEAMPWANVLGHFGGTKVMKAITEKFGKGPLRRISLKLFGQGALESGEEGLQQLWSNAAAIAGYDPERSLTKGVGTAMAVGGLMGGGLGGVVGAGEEIAGRGVEPGSGGPGAEPSPGPAGPGPEADFPPANAITPQDAEALGSLAQPSDEQPSAAPIPETPPAQPAAGPAGTAEAPAENAAVAAPVSNLSATPPPTSENQPASNNETTPNLPVAQDTGQQGPARTDTGGVEGAQAEASPLTPDLHDKKVTLEFRRAKTGEAVQVEMPAKKAEERVQKHLTTLQRIRRCLDGHWV